MLNLTINLQLISATSEPLIIFPKGLPFVTRSLAFVALPRCLRSGLAEFLSESDERPFRRGYSRADTSLMHVISPPCRCCNPRHSSARRLPK